MKFKAVIFDMDGILIDSEIHWHEVEKQIWEDCNIEFTEHFRKKILGKKLSDIIDIAATFNQKLSVSEIHSIFDKHAKSVYGKMSNVMPGVNDLLQKFHASNIKMAIASSSKQEWIDIVLNRFGYAEMFNVLSSAESLGVVGKPNPAVYNVTIERLGLKGKDVIVFEDTSVGTQAAKASGAYVVSVPDDRWSHGDFSMADKILNSLEDFNFDLIQ